jgi:methylated-DNA-[protein]-cysteine S-methyltransferase
MILHFQQITSPLGNLYLVADETNLRAVAFDSNWPRIRESLGAMQEQRNPLLERTEQQLQEYFADQRTAFDLPIQFSGTNFQQQTWRALLGIPYGETRSYSEQAKLLGKPNAVRAIGRTNGLNLISIVVPCHRVIAKSGQLAGYAGGLEAKRFLLGLEGVIPMTA